MRPIRAITLAAAVGAVTLVPASDAAAAGCDKSGYKTLDQTKYVRFERGPVPKGDSTSDFGYYACRIKNGKRYLLGGNECFGNDLGRIGDYAIAGNFIAYEAYTCGDPEGEADVKRLNVSTGAKAGFQAEEGPLPGGGVQDYSITDVVIRGNGNMAWIAFAEHLSGGNQKRYDVRRLIGNAVSRVDFGPNIVPDSLALSGTSLFWLNGAVPKAAGLP
jgi:hypothetical protein